MKDRFEEKTTSYIRNLAERSPAVREMYFYNPEFEDVSVDTSRDILLEKKNTPVKGIIHKFPDRVLFMTSYTCAANCRFCERQDRVGVGLDKVGRLNEDQIEQAVDYIKQNSSIKEVIFSGGDPLTNPLGLMYACELISRINHVKILRIHTKMPLQMPEKTNFALLEKLIKVPQVFYFSVHVNHPDELNEITLPVINRIRRMGYIMLSQSVFLKGINDDYGVLKEMFEILSQNGVRPYYIYHCQKLPTTMRFVMEIEDEIRIMTKLRENMSGLGFPQHVLDLQHTTGKIIVPTGHWNIDLLEVKDFEGNNLNLAERILKLNGNNVLFEHI